MTKSRKQKQGVEPPPNTREASETAVNDFLDLVARLIAREHLQRQSKAAVGTQDEGKPANQG